MDPEILSLESRLTDATRGIDINELDRLYADDIIFTGVTGVICDKNAVMDEARRGATERQAAASDKRAATVVGYDKDDIRCVRHGDTAVTSFRFGITIRADDKEVVRRYRTTNVWVRRGGGWQVVAAHTAGLG